MLYKNVDRYVNLKLGYINSTWYREEGRAYEEYLFNRYRYFKRILVTPHGITRAYYLHI